MTGVQTCALPISFSLRQPNGPPTTLAELPIYTARNPRYIFFAKVVCSGGHVPPVIAGWAHTVIFAVLALVLISREE